MTAVRFLIMLSLYLGAIAVVCSVFTIQSARLRTLPMQRRNARRVRVSGHATFRWPLMALPAQWLWPFLVQPTYSQEVYYPV